MEVRCADDNHQIEIAVVGSGVGGCIAALALAQKYSVALIDKHETPPPRVGECLPPAASRIFGKLNLQHIPGDSHLNAKGMASWWGSEQCQITDNLRNPDGLGWHIDRQLLEKDLRTEALKAKISCYWGSELEAIDREKESWSLTLIDKKQSKLSPIKINAKVIIDASGRHSAFARRLNIKRQQSDRLVSVWMTFLTSDQNKLANICPVDSGWWYCAPVPRLPNIDTSDKADKSGTRVLFYQTDADLLPKAFMEKEALWEAASSLPQFYKMLALADESSLIHQGKVAANSSLLKNAVGENWFAIGDAAMSFDPLSSQGMFNAMASAMQLSDLINHHGINNPGLSKVAAEYQQQLARIWQHYQKHKVFYYSQEKRWASHEFWSRRLS